MGFANLKSVKDMGNSSDKPAPGRYPELTVIGVKHVPDAPQVGEVIVVHVEVTADPIETGDKMEDGTTSVASVKGSLKDLVFKIGNGDKWGYGKSDLQRFSLASEGKGLESLNGHDLAGSVEAAVMQGAWNGRKVSCYASTKPTEESRYFVKYSFAPAETTREISTAPAATPPTPAPAAAPPPAPSTTLKAPPPGFFHFPEGDERRGKQAYNAAHATVDL